MTKEQLAVEIKKRAFLKGDFILRSGASSSYYFDKYMLESDPKVLQNMCSYLKEQIPADTEALAGLEMGGIPLAVALALQTHLPMVFVRKKAKDYGTKKITEGLSIKNKKVCVIEDVISTGGQVIQSVSQMRKEGAVIEKILCVIHRESPDSIRNLKQAHLQLYSLFKADELF